MNSELSQPETGQLTLAPPPDATLEAAISTVGAELLSSIQAVLGSLPNSGSGPGALGRLVGVDKVLASRVLKAVRSRDAISAMHGMPGPDPLRRMVRGAARRGVPAGTTNRANAAIDAFDALIRDRVGDRSLLDTIISAWVPDARREFELRRKQAAFKAISQLRGVQADSNMATVVLYPSTDGQHIDVVWVNGLFELHRVRPGVGVKLTTRRLGGADTARRPVSLGGTPVEDLSGLLLADFCSDPLPRMAVQHMGDAVHYTLAQQGFGQASSVDVVFAEANLNELVRYVPPGSNRKSYFFAEAVTPAKVLQFDLLVHEDLYPGQTPSLRLYDTSFEGVANPNNPARDIDQLDMMESIEDMGSGLSRFRAADVPRYAELLGRVFDRMHWDPGRCRGYRCRIDYPVYGSQVTMVFRAQERDATGP